MNEGLSAAGACTCRPSAWHRGVSSCLPFGRALTLGSISDIATTALVFTVYHHHRFGLITPVAERTECKSSAPRRSSYRTAVMAAVLPYRDINVHSSPSHYAFSSPSSPTAPTLVVERPSGDLRLHDGKLLGSKRVSSIAGILGIIKLRLGTYNIQLPRGCCVSHG
jgi:hypothetical protein